MDPNFLAQTKETKQNQSTAMESDDHNGKDYPDVPEAQNLDIKNTPTHTKDNKNYKAKPHKKPALLDRPIQKFATKKKES